MIARFAKVLYWIACSFAAMMIIFGMALWSTDINATREPFTIVVVCGGLALVVWLIGWTGRYVLADQTHRTTRGEQRAAAL
jgi:hypothetical protein